MATLLPAVAGLRGGKSLAGFVESGHLHDDLIDDLGGIMPKTCPSKLLHNPGNWSLLFHAFGFKEKFRALWLV